ncbi:MAG: hypothetical protein A2W99_10330 [Bacteroidetes bacterium GWF2_33_16]|nr:MAG: hypothetical protein A2X00_05410 [Bacteroidetes bacterium GWE2_32_14]OFY03945.1 MAG: hypothetical protein A2W99_10330 [Bacteroidetes bacterium GWF2_33_16]
MKNYRTIIHPEPSPNKIGYQTPVLFMGSCFTENIGNKMLDLKFPALVNPFGVMYNPVSVQSGLEILIEQSEFKESDLGLFNDQWFSFYHDTEFSDVDQTICLGKINKSIELASRQLRNADYLLITFGTSWVYKYLKSGNIVSNCHKIPAKEFERIKLDTEDIFVEWANLINRLHELNKNLKIIFTVSPVRHWKDGPVQNQLSKSTLILAIHQLKERFKSIEYFPAYEILMDDLRDYRFYADDMLHPSKVAIDYIWDQFVQTYLEKKTVDITKEVERILLAKTHRPLNQNTPSHKKFIESQIKLIEELEKKYTFLDFVNDRSFFKSQI